MPYNPNDQSEIPMKKILVMIIAIAMICMLMPKVASAASGTITHSGTYDIGDYGHNSTITINGGLDVTLTNTTGTTFNNMQIACIGANTTLTIDNIEIDNYSNNNTCALSFNSSGNKLILQGESELISGQSEAGVRVNEGTELEISGDGELEARSYKYAAGIGSSGGNTCGKVDIKSGTIVARGGSFAAGIGGGVNIDGGTITILGGKVSAYGGAGGAGIGSGENSQSGNITICGGVVKARGGQNCAGIGTGEFSTINTIIITGGKVTATGSYGCAGIGGGKNVVGGVITISGGVVDVAHGGSGALHDINGAAAGQLKIVGDAAVILWNDSCITPVAPTHTHFGKTPVENSMLFGVKVIMYTFDAGGYIIPCTLSFDANGGTGSLPPNSTQHKGTTKNLPQKGDLVNDNLRLAYWGTKPDGTGINYVLGGEYEFHDTETLYAIWVDEDVTSIDIDKDTLELIGGETSVLTANVTPSDATKNEVMWYSSDNSVATVDNNGVVRGEGVGSATITAWADGKSDTCTVTVSKCSVSGVTLNNSSLDMVLGEKELLVASITPSGATDSAVTWTSSDSTIAVVDGNGLVEAMGNGTCTIEAEVDGVSASCKVTVVERATKVTLKEAFVELLVGQSAQLQAETTPSNATKSIVTWESGDTGVAKVDTSGKVVAVGEGATSVVLTVDGVSDACAIVVKKSDEQEKDDNDNLQPTPTPEPTIVPQVTSNPQPTPEQVVIEKNTVIINTSDLPEGTRWIRIPSGEVVLVEGDSIEVELNGSEPMEIIALDDEKIPLGHMNVNISVQMADDGVPVWVIVLGALIGAVVIGGMVLLVIRKFGIRKV